MVGTPAPADLQVMSVRLAPGSNAGGVVRIRVRLRNNSGQMVNGFQLNTSYRPKGSTTWIPFGMPGTSGVAGAMPGYGMIDRWSSRDIDVAGMIADPGEYDFRAEVATDPVQMSGPDPDPSNNVGEMTCRLDSIPPPSTDIGILDADAQPEDGTLRGVATIRNNGPLHLSEAFAVFELLDASDNVLQSATTRLADIPAGATREKSALLLETGASGFLHYRIRLERTAPIDLISVNDSWTR